MRFFILFAVTFLLSLSVQSQQKFGVFAGPNYPGVSEGFGNNILFDSQVSFHIGILFEKPIREKIAFRPKIVYSQQGDRKGTKISNISGDAPSYLDYKLNYLNATLNFKFFKRPYLLIGPQLGYLVSEESLRTQINDLSSFDAGLNIGSGIDIQDFFLELSIYHGLTDIANVTSASGIPRDDSGVRNFVLSVSVGYKFDL